MENELWIVVDIGCIECSEPSRVLGVFTTERVARVVRERANREWRASQWTGEHHFDLFRIPGVNWAWGAAGWEDTEL